GTQHIKAELDSAKTQMEQARRASDFAKMSELQYGVIPALEKHWRKQNPLKAKK
ncbi:ClpB, partial [Pasteurella multocida subsp. multocida str. Anand1_cattle]